MTGEQVKRFAIPGTLSLAIRIGEAVLEARSHHRDPIDAICEVSGGRQLFAGKVSDVQREMKGGFARGVVSMAGIGDHADTSLRIDFQNENLIARTGTGETIAVVPDLICIVDSGDRRAADDRGHPLRNASDRARDSSAAQLRTPEGLAAVGPAAFSYPDVAYVPLPGIYGGTA